MSVIVNEELAKTLGLLPEEFIKIQEILGRVPNYTELSIYSVMWSEHCSYKNSIKYLKKLPRKGKALLVEAGEENAGLVDIGNGWACAFKIESHNHPSAVEPFQGAATGVGGISRDIFTMGARPIASLNSLRFGLIDNKRTQHLLKGVVKGIGHYGNCFGVPTVAGEVYFDDCYQVNPLVNAMSVGIVKIGDTISATSYGKGNPVYIVGSATGKDGIHGATFASEDLGEDAEDKIPSVQVGDPFVEKLLLEATLEVIKTGAVIGMQDMGAAGITCSTSEMSAKGEHGMKIWLDKVPTRQKNMLPFEILLSESQERMLIVVEKGKEALVEAVFDKWDLNCAVIGEVTEGNTLEYYMNGELVAEVPADTLVLGGGAPVYDRAFSKPKYHEERDKYSIEQISEPNIDNLKEISKAVVAYPNIASKRFIYKQYDSMVGVNNTGINEPSDANIIRLKESNKGLVVTVDCNSRYVHADAEVGGAIAVAEAARNITCSGGKPVAITNCLNFGNPYDPEVYWNFVHALQGMSASCIKFDTPVTGGNVSFYNQSPNRAVNPTPTIGMLGVIEDVQNKMTLDFKNESDLIYQIGASKNDISSSEYLFNYHKVELSPAPYFNLDEEYAMQNAVSDLIENKLVQSVHDISEGGLFIAIMESAMPRNYGFEINTSPSIRKDAFLFGEAQGRAIASVTAEQKAAFELLLTQKQIPFELVGQVKNKAVVVDGLDFGNIEEYKDLYDTSIEKYMEA
ncbi:MAG TPA: phosphoribosylformylglycinamidine synthase subunit PurL [Chitinophagales bacterium]|nr:phosphoribosylformylglycinamidine synthase subunit PurL [Chitinophagales bacterium]HMU97992.1 phosphoribosylformylglycinamidine synthase subunit PurL [Chitinophagales bacterium]HMV02272.1 phosphoribosylformylglycinamidine synthase subunit PurL [Chitinophagales bacterium]HMW94082.1 phosphoribosylformylglycinamidine synthase subunit PurL [Chitinophagales bacterium]HMY41557.1 phosphoribosylformylglycinamidine synthase subunit PurL [Chitinophagales bacterium]